MRSARCNQRLAVLIGAALLLAGCVGSPQSSARSVGKVTLERNSPGRVAREETLRVRNVDCLSVGSSFAITDQVLVTNRHVTDGGSDLEVETWDGRPVGVSVAGVATINDLSLIFLDGTLPMHSSLAVEDPPPGTRVRAVGFPNGGQLRITSGHILDYVDGAPFGESGQVIRGDFPIHHGNSGGPLLDNSGRVAGIVFAIETDNGRSLAIPQSRLRTLIDTRALTPLNTDCE